MIELLNEPAMFVQKHRELADGRCVLSGPTFSRNFIQAQKEVIDVCVASANASFFANVDFSKPQMLTSSEMLGFDPFSDPMVSLRELQRFSSVVIHGREIKFEPGTFVFRSSRDLRVMRCLLRLTDIVECGDWLRFGDEDIADEFLLLAIELGYVAVPANVLSGTTTEYEVTAAIFSQTLVSVHAPFLFLSPKSKDTSVLFHGSLKAISHVNS